MVWSEFDNSYKGEGSRKAKRRFPKVSQERGGSGEGFTHKQKRSGKRFHRKKTYKDDFWQGVDSPILTKG